MRSKELIEKRMEEYKKNLHNWKVSSSVFRYSKTAIRELNWVLGKETLE